MCVLPSQAEVPLQIRVVLSDTGTKQQLGGSLAWYSGDKLLARSAEAVAITKSGEQVSLAAGGKQFAAPRLRAVPEHGFLRFSGKDYRGNAELFIGKNGGVVVLNLLPLEDYLLGVVAAEMPPSWAPEALKAQAVAARTFALARMAARQDLTYDVYATVNDQVYLGISGEDERTTRAVQATSGQVLTYSGEPITAFFCSDAGGSTKLGTEPYLQPVSCANPDSPFTQWTLELTAAQVDKLIADAGGKTGKITSLTAENDPASGHLVAITFKGAQGECRITGPKLRKLLGLDVMRSTDARVELPGSAPAVERTTVVPDTNVATDIMLGSPAATTPSSRAMQEYERPWVASAAGNAAQKMRVMWCYNGQSLLRCNHEVYVFDVDGSASDAGPVPATPASPPPAAPPVQQTYSEPGGFNGIVLRGSGYGHSLGMSQWGARGLADQGWDYRRILTYFYTGVELVQWRGSLPPVQVVTEEQAGFYAPFVPSG